MEQLLKFTVKESLANQDRLSLKIQLVAELLSKHKVIGTVDIPLKLLLDNPGYKLSCQVYKKHSEKWGTCFQVYKKKKLRNPEGP